MGSTAQRHFPVPPGVANKGGSSSSIPGLIGQLATGMIPGGSIIGSLLGAGLNFGLNRIESGIQNRYNSPKNTIHRLQQAGLPTAAYLDGGGNQSASSSQSFAQPDLGVTESISKEQINRMQKQQFELMKRDMDLKEQELKLRKERTFEIGIRNDYFGRQSGDYLVPNNFGSMIESGNKLRGAQTFLADTNRELKGLERDLFKETYDTKKAYAGASLATEQKKPQLMDQQISESANRIATNMVRMEAMKTQMSVAQQTIAIRQLQEAMEQAILHDIEDSQTGMTGAKAMILKNLTFSPISLNPLKK